MFIQLEPSLFCHSKNKLGLFFYIYNLIFTTYRRKEKLVSCAERRVAGKNSFISTRGIHMKRVCMTGSESSAIYV